MKIPFSDYDFSEEAPPLLLRNILPSSDEDKDLLIKRVLLGFSSPTIFEDHPFELKRSIPLGTRLFLNQAKLIKLIKARGDQYPWQADFTVQLLSEQGASIQEKVSIDFVPEKIVAQLGFSDYKSSSLPVNLEFSTNSSFQELGVLEVDESASAEVLHFQISFTRENPTSDLLENIGTAFRLNKKPPIEFSFLPDGKIRLAFKNTNNRKYPLSIKTDLLNEERVTQVNVYFEGGSGFETTNSVHLESLTAEPRVLIGQFEPLDEDQLTEDGLKIDYKPGMITLGYIPIEVMDYRGEGYNLNGRLINSKGQAKKPFSLEREVKGLAIQQSTLDNYEQRKEIHEFLLTPTKNNLDESLMGRKRKLLYRYKIPIDLDFDLIDFTNAQDNNVVLGFQLELDFAKPATVEVLVRGSSSSSLVGLPVNTNELQERAIRLESPNPSVEVEYLKLRNAATLGFADEISLRLRELELTDKTTGQKSEDWKVIVTNGPKEQLTSTEDNRITYPPLSPRKIREIKFRLIPQRALTSRTPPRHLTLKYKLDQLIHKRDKDANHFDLFPSGITTFERVIPLKVAPIVQKTYLSIDLGTSAIVAATANDRESEFSFKFLDLQKRLESLRKQAGRDYNKDFQLESKTPFIASNIVLRNKKNIDANNLEDSTLNLSPPLGALFQHRDAWLPNIKMLFGRLGVPKLKKAFGSDFEYYINGKRLSTAADGPEVVMQTLHALVNLILEGFIRPLPPVAEKANNQLEVVFTVPNNFTQSYRDKIKEWAHQIRSSSHPGLNVHFISESDAVAYSYLDFWELLHPDKEKEKEELILAYDIGAGTVDLSLIKRRYNPLDKKNHQVLVLGRVGLPKAGNYLDFVLAKVVWKLYGPESLRPIFIDFDPFSGLLDIGQTLEFHGWIRNELKPELAKVTRSDWEKEYVILLLSDKLRFIKDDLDRREINLSSIITDQDFQDYLQSVTDTALGKLMYNAFGKTPPPAIDTVLFSGRTIQMNCLHEAVLEAIKSLPNQKPSGPSDIYPDNWKMGNLKSPASKLKGIVALGGLRYLRRYSQAPMSKGYITLGEQKIHAAYGVFFNSSGTALPKYEFLELIHPRKFKTYGKTYSTEIDLGDAQRLYILQTYESDSKIIASTFKNGTFTGDFTVNLLENEAILFQDYGILASDIVRVDLTIVDNHSLTLEFLNSDGVRIHEQVIQNYRRGYNQQSPEATQSLWPFIDIEKH